MLRFRRYRVFLVFAVITTAALYHFSNIRHWETSPPISVDSLKNLGLKDHLRKSSTTANTLIETPPPSTYISKLSGAQSSPSSATSYLVQKLPPTTSSSLTSPLHSSKNTVQLVQSTNTPKGPAGLATHDKPTESARPPDPENTPLHGQGRLEVAPDHTNAERPHWRMLQEHFPVPPESITPIPTGEPRRIPKIQHTFTDESSNSRIDRERKLATIKDAFTHSWEGYKQHAWLQDELSPVSGKFRNPFCGWAATLVDSLDALWILGMKDEFEEAANAVKQIDFTTSVRNDIPLFETTIRYLGGLIAAYDLSGGRYNVLLDKSIELAEVLMGAFDTPNRMPITYYQWKPAFSSQPHRANTRVILAELGSLSLEFTRLAQITKNAKYYDAIARITNEFEKWQNNTKLPGMWPISVDASGCAKPAGIFGRSVDQTMGKRQLQRAATMDEVDPMLSSRKDNSDIGDPECQPQGLASPPQENSETFTLGGMSDSVYEYLPKEYLLLGGLNDQYRNMFQQSLDVVKKHLLFRPMAPDNRNVLFSGSVRSKGNPELADNIELNPEGQHLTCFAGGMIAIGARIFNHPEDLDIAAKLADGCVWAYESTTTGIMPEGFILVPCPSKEYCPWNETLWMEALDPSREDRERQRVEQEQSILVSEGRAAKSPGVNKGDSTLSSNSPAAGSIVPGPAYGMDKSLRKRQLQDIDNDLPTAGDPTNPPAERLVPQPAPKPFESARQEVESLNNEPSQLVPLSTTSAATLAPLDTPTPIMTHKEFAMSRIENERLPEGFTSIWSRKYILRPEATESVFIMYRTTGDEYWREKGWEMFTAIQKHTRVEFGNSAIDDVTSSTPNPVDEMESFWLAETLKYFYLLFSDPSVVSLDEYVLNTEAHPFRRPK